MKHCKIQYFYSANSQASDGWTYYFKKKYNIVDRHIDKLTVAKPVDDLNHVDFLVERFTLEQIPMIRAYTPNKVK